MDRRVPLPVFGGPPEDYERLYFDDLTRKLNQLMSILKSPGEGRNTKITLTNLPTSASGLEVGAVYMAPDGTLKIVQPTNVAYASETRAVGNIGSVTVTT